MMKLFFRWIIISAILFNFSISFAQPVSGKSDKASVAQQTLQSLPAVFRKNAGQWDNRIICKTVASGANVSFLRNGVSFGFRKRVNDDDVAPDAPGSFYTQQEPEK